MQVSSFRSTDRTPDAAVAPSPVSTVERSLATAFSRSGVGLHSGEPTTVTVKPAVGEGRYFVRTDLPDSPPIPACMDAVTQTLLSTELGAGTASVRTVEHVLAALSGMGIDHARIEVDGPEIPLLDGSAKDWGEAIAQAGWVEIEGSSRSLFNLPEPIWIYDKDSFVAAIPAPFLRLTYGIEFDLDAIGTQWYSWNPYKETFFEAIAPARTFGLAHQIEALKQQGLIKGGSLDNALVCGENGWLNPPLRFSNEPVRHKLLDLVGDLSLVGSWPSAHILAYKASHRLHTQLSKVLAQIATA
ncbi:MAG: UDP-3-O-acyl-N-acetylglucosamine deacetylase [Leptolyngbyaceae bacterium]|nr:UDP-3-O-acyl-N-acetylglucosamine deacetylase [Leptolyngbyaceae bacterium]